MTQIQQTAIEYIKLHEKLPIRTLAKKIQSEQGGTVENWRSVIRRLIGQSGSKSIQCEFNKQPAENANNLGVPNPLQYQTYERKTPAKILVFDIETAPMKVYIFNMWNENIGTHQIISDWFCLTWSAKWLFEDKIYNAKLKPSEIKKEDDYRIIKSIHKMLDDADIVIAHNGIKFDIKKLYARFIMHNMPPPSPFQVIDTYQHSKKIGQSSNKLDYLSQLYNGRRKIKTDFELWKRCMEFDKSAIEEMSTYNDGDVYALEDLYLRIRPYIKPHPNIGLFIGTNVSCCSACGSTNLVQKGQYHTFVNIYDSFQCNDCGSWMRSRKTETKLRDNTNLKTSLPR